MKLKSVYTSKMKVGISVHFLVENLDYYANDLADKQIGQPYSIVIGKRQV